MENKYETIIRNCKTHGETEYYVYYYEGKSPARFCKKCTRERRKSRKHNPKQAKIDREYNSKWVKNNPEKIKASAERQKAKNQEKIENINREKFVLFTSKISDLRELFKIYRPTKNYTDYELIEMSIKFSKGIKHKFSWNRFVERMGSQIRHSKYVNTCVILKTKYGWIKQVNNERQNNYSKAPKRVKTKLRKEALAITNERFNSLKIQLDQYRDE